MKDYEKILGANINKLAKRIAAVFSAAASEAAAIGASIPNFDHSRPFDFTHYPQTKKRIDKLLNSLQSDVTTAIVSGVDASWSLSNNKNSELAKWVFGDSYKKLTSEQERKYFSNNDAACEAFKSRKVDGLDLSDKVWKYANGFKSEIEMGLDLGLRDGLSASEMARDLKLYLQQPDNLFRRVRDKHGQLHLSQKAKAYHPGQGVYRSSYKNALRTARTETNIAYRTADYERWQQLDFVVGIEVLTSNNHPIADICDSLAGRYPKDFKFTGWHPQCRCRVVSILKTPEELMADNERILDGEETNIDSVNRVGDVPPQFKEWLSANAERSKTWSSNPYFIRDNEQYVSGVKGKNTWENSRPKEQEAHSNGIIQASYPGITNQVIEVENEIRMNKTFETAVAFDKNGSVVIDKRGAAYSVNFTPEECKAAKDSVFTHNHPRGWSAKEDTLGRIGNSFSIEDIAFAVGNDLAEIRAVTPTYTFVMRRPENGWSISAATLKKEFDRADMEMKRKMNAIISKAATQKEMQRTIEHAKASHFHLVWKELAKKYGFEYMKTKSIR